MKNQTYLIRLLVTVTVLSACSTTDFNEDNSYKFGEATHANIAKHAIEPDPVLKENTFIPANRDRVLAAREAYKNGKVKQLEPSSAQFD